MIKNMKRTLILILSALMLTTSLTVSAAENCQGDWKQKMMSEKTAFLTMEMGFTPEEAQEFWPVYNEIDKMRDEAMRKVFHSFKALEDGIAAGKSDKEISKLLGAYLDALEAQDKVEEEAREKYEDVLPVDKLAKLYVSEEKFRRQHIRRLHRPEDKK